MYTVVFIAVFFFLPIYIGHVIGAPKNRAGWAWGFAPRWLGVVIVSLLGKKRVGYSG
jgi:hypothetical protein